MSTHPYYPNLSVRMAARAVHDLFRQFGDLDRCVADGADGRPLVGPMLVTILRAAVEGDLIDQSSGRGLQLPGRRYTGESAGERWARIVAALTAALHSDPDTDSYQWP